MVEGDGTGAFDFSNFDSYQAGSSTFGLDIAKLPGDKWSDIVTANSGGGISIFNGKRNGTFEEANNLPMGDNDDDVVVADLNRDGVPDIATSDFVDQVVVRYGKQNGDYRDPEFHVVETGPVAIAVGKLDGDNRPDLVTANRTSGDVAVLLGRRNGFKAADHFDLFDGDLKQARLDVADFDKDGMRDVAVAYESGEGLQVMRGRGDGRLRAPIAFNGAVNAAGVVIGDFRPGKGPDAAVTDAQEDGAVAVYLNR